MIKKKGVRTLSAFLILCVLASSLYIGQSFLSSEQISVQIKELIEKNKLNEKGIEVSFSSASASLVGSFSHPIGIRVKDLKVALHRNCQTFKIDTQTLVVPFHLLKVLDNNLEIGLVRLSDLNFNIENKCEDSKNKPKYFSETSKRLNKKKVEQEVIEFFSKLKKVNFAPLKTKSGEFKYLGFLIYNIKLDFKGGTYFIDRFKTLFGSGDIEAKGEWSSSLLFEDSDLEQNKKSSKVDVDGSFSYSKNTLKSVVNLKEKESSIQIALNLLRNTARKNITKTKPDILLSLKTVPVSFFSKLKKIKLAGLNLRKTWIDTNLSVDFQEKNLLVTAESFKAYGDFGTVEMGHAKPVLKWSKNSEWLLKETTRFKLQDIDFFKVLSLRPQKKVSRFFGDFGKFNASIDFKSINVFQGDFETKDFSVLLRSMGKKVYQKVEFARGSLNFEKGKMLSFALEELALKDGDFEGFLRFDYNYSKKNIYADFNLSHLRFAPEITKGLFNVDLVGNLELKGKGFVSKKNLTTKTSSKSINGELDIQISSEGVASKHWGFKEMKSDCSIVESNFNCKLGVGEFFLSEVLSEKLNTKNQKFTDLKSREFSFKNKKLTLKLRNSQAGFDFDWSPRKGLMILGSESEEMVSIRSLD